VDGSAVLSRLPLVESDCLALSLRPGLEDTNRRALLHAQVNLPDGGGPVHLFNAHLSWVYAQAQDNLEEALPYINSVSGPALMLGDMNMLPDSDLWLPLREAGWVDTWQALRPDDDGYTYESDRPYMRIDYAWANRLLAGQPKAIEVLAKERDGVRMSDHLGLLVTL
jgi:endonuclease/exonuclease/phosphatase family metal-dependent hydrolase